MTDSIFEYLKIGIQIIGLIAMFVEITPVKLSPLKWIGSRLNADLKKDVTNIENRLNDLEQKEIQKDVEKKRSTILSFSNSLRQDKRHTAEEFDHILQIIDDYELLCQKNNIKNGVIKVQSQYIIDTYYMLSKKGEFRTKVKTGELL